jgi:maleylacetate reductase
MVSFCMVSFYMAAHCVEGFYAQNCNPITSLMAEAAIRALAANLPHAETHAVILPHVVAFNRLHADEAMQALARGLQVEVSNTAGALHDPARLSACLLSLQELGLQAGDLDQVAELATRNPYYNPRPVERPGVRTLLQAAFDGTRPASL